MRVFLTGATGFVMGAVARRLRARDDEVVALVRSRTRGRELERLGCDFVEGDIVDLDQSGKDRLRTCDSLVHGGEIASLDDAYRAVAKATGRPLPSLVIPDGLLRIAARLVPSLREVVSSAAGVTFWATDAKARSELGTRPRALLDGIRDTFGAASDDGPLSAGPGRGDPRRRR